MGWEVTPDAEELLREELYPFMEDEIPFTTSPV